MSLDSSTDEPLEEGFDFRQPLSLFWWLLGMVFGLYDQSRVVKVKQT